VFITLRAQYSPFVESDRSEQNEDIAVSDSHQRVSSRHSFHLRLNTKGCDLQVTGAGSCIGRESNPGLAESYEM
jgi:hypothetical protein